jgi:RNA polymerase sigma-70 factor (ECF subfamily)
MEDDKSLDAKHDEFLRLFSSHSQRIYEFILMLVLRRVDAEEIFQDTCLILWKKFDGYDPNGNFHAWACRIAYLEILQLRRTNRRLQTFSEEALSLLADKALAHSSNLGRRQQLLEECLEKLGSQDRELIEQRYYYRRTPKEIAGVKTRSVYSIYRALGRVHRSLFECVQNRLSREEGR